jgi:hypothetical protein
VRKKEGKTKTYQMMMDMEMNMLKMVLWSLMMSQKMKNQQISVNNLKKSKKFSKTSKYQIATSNLKPLMSLSLQTTTLNKV